MNYKLNVPRNAAEDLIEQKRIDQILFYGIIFIIAVLPLIIRVKMIDFISPIIVFDNVISSGPKGDVFTYYKFLFLFWVTIILLGLFIYRLSALGNSLIKEPTQFYFLLFSVVVALSAVFSPYTNIALFGMYNRHDGAITTTLVVILFLIAANLTYTKKQLLIIAYAFTPVVLLNLCIGLNYFYGNDLIQIPFIKSLIVPSALGTDIISETSRLQTTINNPNYLSGLAAMTTFLYLTLALFLKTSIHRVVFFLLSLASFVLMLTALSLSGFFTIIVLIGLLLILIIKLRAYKQAIPLLLLAFTLFFTSIYIMQQENKRVWDETFGLFKISNPFIEQPKETGLSEYSTFTSAIQFGTTAFANENVEDKIELPQFPSPGMSSGTGRSYIWDRTMALLMERPLIGYGLDTLIYAFPQYELEKQAGLRTMEVLVDKPHNIFIGIAYGSGIVALLLFLLGVLVIVMTTVKQLWNKHAHPQLPFVMAFLFFILAFLVQGIPNDAIIGVYPLFWIILGVLVSLLNQQKTLNQTTK